METPTLHAKARPAVGKRAARKLREEGMIPAIIYGHKLDAVSVALSAEDFESAIRHHVRVVELKVGDASETALIKDIQYDYLGRSVIHLDFERVSKDERIEVEVPIELRGIAPGVGQGVLDQPLHSLQVECLAIEIPESIRVNISALKFGEVIHVKELTLPPGVKALNEPDAVVVQVKAHAIDEDTPVVAAEGGVEPEIVGRRVAKDEPEE